MELFERIIFFSKATNNPLVKISDSLGIKYNVFHKWLNEDSQRNLWKHLPKILEHYPQLSREWLYFGEGEMLVTQPKETITKEELLEKVKLLEEEKKLLEEEKKELSIKNNELRSVITDISNKPSAIAG